jgi:hypothetical protein
VSDRLVLVRVTDPRVDGLYQAAPTPDGGVWIVGDVIPVPEDDQLREDARLVLEAANEMGTYLANGNELEWATKIHEAHDRLRAAYGLDTEDDNE